MWEVSAGGARGPEANDAERMGNRKPPVLPEPVCDKVSMAHMCVCVEWQLMADLSACH